MATPAQIKANRKNAKKGGRPVSSATLKTQHQREILLALLEEEATNIFNALIKKAVEGDVPAAKELFDRAYGKAPQAITGGDGKELVIHISGETATRYGTPRDTETSSS